MSHQSRAAGTTSRSPWVPARARQTSQSPAGPPWHGDQGADPWPGLVSSSWQRQSSDFELPLTRPR